MPFGLTAAAVAAAADGDDDDDNEDDNKDDDDTVRTMTPFTPRGVADVVGVVVAKSDFNEGTTAAAPLITLDGCFNDDEDVEEDEADGVVDDNDWANDVIATIG